MDLTHSVSSVLFIQFQGKHFLASYSASFRKSKAPNIGYTKICKQENCATLWPHRPLTQNSDVATAAIQTRASTQFAWFPSLHNQLVCSGCTVRVHKLRKKLRLIWIAWDVLVLISWCHDAVRQTRDISAADWNSALLCKWGSVGAKNPLKIKLVVSFNENTFYLNDGIRSSSSTRENDYEMNGLVKLEEIILPKNWKRKIHFAWHLLRGTLLRFVSRRMQ